MTQYSKIDDALIAGMFERMALDTPGLEAVSAAIETADLSAAEAAYLEHYRDRQQPVLDWEAMAASRRTRAGGTSSIRGRN